MHNDLALLALSFINAVTVFYTMTLLALTCTVVFLDDDSNFTQSIVSLFYGETHRQIGGYQ